MPQPLAQGVVHTVPSDLRAALLANIAARDIWQSLTPLSRNEWICWTTSVKKIETRKEHVARVVRQLNEGKRRPCCWIGCVHRTDKAVSKSVQGILNSPKSKKTTR